MDDLIKRAEDWLKERGGYDGYSEKDVADIITALFERVKELEAALEHVQSNDTDSLWRAKEIARKALGRDGMSELSRLFNMMPDIEAVLNDQIENMPLEQKVLNMRGTITRQMQEIDRLKGELEETKKQYDGLYLQYTEAVFRESDTKRQLFELQRRMSGWPGLFDENMVLKTQLSEARAEMENLRNMQLSGGENDFNRAKIHSRTR